MKLDYLRGKRLYVCARLSACMLNADKNKQLYSIMRVSMGKVFVLLLKHTEPMII